MAKQALPTTPFDGQVYYDMFKVKWVYNAEDATWNKVGVAVDVPIARGEDNELGPTNGLFSARDKSFLDSLPERAGGFGFIFKPGRYLTEQYGPDSILSGNVQFVSETLNFECVSTGLKDCNNGSDLTPTVKIGLSQDFLESFRLEIKGPKGPDGNPGEKGIAGRPGTGDGPRGDAGEDGADAGTPHAFTGIIYEELDTIYSTAVVDLRLDNLSGILEVTKASLDIPGGEKPARRVVASPVLRDVEFLSSDLDQWQLSAPLDDNAQTVDLNLIKLPKGWSGGSDNAVPVTPVKLSGLVNVIIGHYKTSATKIIRQWDTELKTWVRARDKEARDVLNELATQLADCEFQLPLEFCIGVAPSDCSSSTSQGSLMIIMFHDTSSYNRVDAISPFYNGPAQYGQDLMWLQNTINKYRGSLFTDITIRLLNPVNPSEDPIIPVGVPPQGYTYTEIGRPPGVDELVQAYNTSNDLLNFPPNNVHLLVNNSGSMVTATIEPGYGEFIEWLGDNTNATVFEQNYVSSGFASRWVMVIRNYIETLAANIEA